jgi:hypothetical protein
VWEEPAYFSIIEFKKVDSSLIWSYYGRGS